MALTVASAGSAGPSGPEGVAASICDRIARTRSTGSFVATVRSGHPRSCVDGEILEAGSAVQLRQLAPDSRVRAAAREGSEEPLAHAVEGRRLG
jgi:hypothetical protein